MNVAVTGAVVPNEYAGMLTFAFVAVTTDKLCKPMPVSAMSTVTEAGPDVIAWNAWLLPVRTSVTVIVGVQFPPGVDVGVGTGVGIGVAVGVGVGIGGAVGVGVGVVVAVGLGVGFGVGVAVGIGVGVAAGPPVHCALIKTAFIRDEARSVKSAG